METAYKLIDGLGCGSSYSLGATVNFNKALDSFRVRGFFYVLSTHPEISRVGRRVELIKWETPLNGHFTGGFVNQPLHPAKREKKRNEDVFISFKSQQYKPKKTDALSYNGRFFGWLFPSEVLVLMF